MNIKSIILTKIRFCFSKRFKKQNSKSFLSFFIIPSDNQVNIINSRISRSKIAVLGIKNVIEIEGYINKSTIHIEGNNNTLIIRRDSQLHSMYLSIVGDGCTIEIGENVFFHSGYVFSGGKKTTIKIGNSCLFAHDVDIMNSDSHQILINGKETNFSRDVIIGNHVWVGAHVSILKGVTIGDDSIIGTRSVVTKNIIANTLNVGNPCRMLKEKVDWSIKRNSI